MKGDIVNNIYHLKVPLNSIYYHFDVVTQLHTQTHGLIKYYGNANNIRLKRITCKNKDCLARIHVSVPECSDISPMHCCFSELAL